jgi:serine protease Do
MTCVCGHPDHDHTASGKCRVPDCPCEQFQPGYTLQGQARRAGRGADRDISASGGETSPRRNAVSRAILGRGLALTVALAFACGPGPSRLAHAGEPAVIPDTFAEVAATALAASFVIRASGVDAAAEGFSVPTRVDADEDLQEDGWEPGDAAAVLRDRTVGAGVIIDPRGIALTSARAILRPQAFEVVLMDGTPVKATVVALDRRTDVAVLRLESRGGFFPHLPLGDSDRVRLGDWVLSVGAPLGLEGTVSAGVITATPMPASPSPSGSYLQSDTVRGLGRAGGPLVNLSGEVVGLGTTFVSEARAHAIPSRTLRRVYLELLEKGRVSRPWLATTTQSLDARLARALKAPDAAGALIADVLAGGPGAAAGLRPGDIVVEIGTSPLSSRLQLERAVSSLAPGDVVNLKLRRQGRLLTIAVTLGEEPDGALPPARALARKRLGIDVRPISPTTGAVARNVDRWSSATRAGIEEGDVIREVNGLPIHGTEDFLAIARTLTPGAPVLMRVQRGDVVLYIVVTAAR